jgi:glycosyltransferase involved in cell wall biosynthesis
MEPVFSQVAEIITVDGDSTDGTSEILREFCAKRVNATSIFMEEGLYNGWNSAVYKSTQKWVYFSTIGDWISLDGLLNLLEIAQWLESDVTISPPRIVEGRGRVVSNFKWPIHHFVDSLEDNGPLLLDSDALLPWVVGLLPSSFLGSSASNLYRGEFLKKHPFPVGFGHAGDTAWMLEVARHVRCGIFPEEVADFYLQEKKSDKNPAQKWALIKKLQDHALISLGNINDPLDSRTMGWLKAHFENQAAPWNWLASLADLPAQYEEILQYNKLMSEELSRTFPEKLMRFIKRRTLQC